LSDCGADGLDGSGCSLTQQMLELGEDLLNQVQIGRIFRQEDQLCASGADEAANGFILVTAEIVHDDDVAGTKRRDEDLLDIVLKALAVDWTIKRHGASIRSWRNAARKVVGIPVASRLYCYRAH